MTKLSKKQRLNQRSWVLIRDLLAQDLSLEQQDSMTVDLAKSTFPKVNYLGNYSGEPRPRRLGLCFRGVRQWLKTQDDINNTTVDHLLEYFNGIT